MQALSSVLSWASASGNVNGLASAAWGGGRNDGGGEARRDAYAV